MNFKKLFSPFVYGDITYPTREELKEQINSNLTVMNWMFFILLICLLAALQTDSLMLYVLAILILVFISTLHHSQKLNRVILEVRRR